MITSKIKIFDSAQKSMISDIVNAHIIPLRRSIKMTEIAISAE